MVAAAERSPGAAMMPQTLRRKTILLLLIAVLAAAPWASAAGGPAVPGPAAVFAYAQLDLFSSAWRFLTSLWSKEGCAIDPDGRCAPGAFQQSPSTIKTDSGCAIDPNGHCLTRPANQSDSGCHIDPNGLCRS
jgi:hypothetical protein